MGIRDGSIIATIITIHMPRNDAAASGHVCPGVRIHAIDMVQSPGIGIPPIADMDVHQTIVTAELATKNNAETPTKARLEVRSEAKPACMLRQICGSKLLAKEVVLVMMLLLSLHRPFGRWLLQRRTPGPTSG